MFRKLVVVLTILLYNVSVIAQPIAPNIRLLVEDLAAVSAELEDALRAQRDAVELLVEIHDFDPDALVNHMRRAIQYTPYLGALKGPSGALESGYANSYDQALALAALLQASGQTAQVLAGPLNLERFPDAPEPPTSAAPFQAPQSGAIADLNEEMQEIAEALSAFSEADAADDSPQTAFPKDFEAVANAVLASAAPLLAEPRRSFAQAAAEEAETLYAVVRWRASPLDDWTWIDPARGADLSGLNAADFTVISNEVPDEHAINVDIRLVVETTTAGSQTLGRVDGPSALLAGVSPRFSILPANMVLNGGGSEDMFDHNQDLVVVSETFPSMVITRSGAILTFEDYASEIGALFSTNAAQLSDMISTLEQDSAAPQDIGPNTWKSLERVALEVSIASPSGTLTRVRPLYERDHTRDEAPAAHAVMASLPGEHMLFVGFETDPRLETNIAATAIMQIMAEATLDKNYLQTLDPERLANIRLTMERTALRSLFIGQEGEAPPPHITPSVAMVSTKMAPSGKNGEALMQVKSDILHDGRSSYTVDEAVMRGALAAAAQEKVVVEAFNAALEAQGGQRITSDDDTSGTYDKIAALTASGVAPLALGAADADTSYRCDAYAPVLTRALADRDVIVWSDEDCSRTAWLEVDRRDGSMRAASGETGAGEELTAGAILLSIIQPLQDGIACFQKSEGPTARSICTFCLAVVVTFAIAAMVITPMGVLGFIGAAVITGGLTEFAKECYPMADVSSDFYRAYGPRRR